MSRNHLVRDLDNVLELTGDILRFVSYNQMVRDLMIKKPVGEVTKVQVPAGEGSEIQQLVGEGPED
jgi:hypothetical protein